MKNANYVNKYGFFIGLKTTQMKNSEITKLIKIFEKKYIKKNYYYRWKWTNWFSLSNKLKHKYKIIKYPYKIQHFLQI